MLELFFVFDVCQTVDGRYIASENRNAFYAFGALMLALLVLSPAAPHFNDESYALRWKRIFRYSRF